MADSAKGPKLRSTRPDLASILGIVVAFGAIAAGLLMEKGSPSDVMQVSAAVIVLGGTLGACMITAPLSSLIAAAKGLKSVFLQEVIHTDVAIEEVIRYATKARKSSVISLEEDLPGISDPFLQKALTLAVDGTDISELRQMMELELSMKEKHAEAAAKVFEAAGGYSPTVGIIGAVLGLIQVMKHLEDISEVGRGIAVAFVATVYGVAVANLFFLPAASKLKSRIHDEVEANELMLTGVGSILEGMNPKLIRVKLEAFLHDKGKKKAKGEAEGAGAEQAAAAGD